MPELIALPDAPAPGGARRYLLRFPGGRELPIGFEQLDQASAHAFLDLGQALPDDGAGPAGVVAWAVYLASREAFEALGLQKLSLELPVADEPTVLRCRAMGFQVEGRLRQHLPGDGRRGDLLRLALTAREWKALAQPLLRRLQTGETEDAFAPGSRHVERYRLAAEDIDRFAEASGDRNPIHMSDEAGRAAGFDGRIAHGMLAAATISRLLGTVFPGHGTVYLGQELRFLRPVYPDQALSAELTVLRRAGQRATLRTLVTDADGRPLVDGEAEVMLPKLPLADPTKEP